ncbi:MAG TPA: prenyltransferase/squalene oxidase repeat-containing protein [Solirubrobacteraceae bacterium]|nr:prenyltransferase/squalene oxidase repeat-containing protein [Solirubrobacteraceae bacterium]
MSWPVAAFLVVAVVLGVGWVAYERTRPSARMVAVVATLAAIAALGRDAFVALPDVKPITAMTLVVGYGLGPLPGFTVGALGMLASNILLGQGPYTPWQMAAWGLVGLTGAAIGKLSSRRLGRVPLALACGVCALGAKEIMNVYTWTLGASHTPAAFLVVAGAALPFDALDAVASVLFGFAFGPELARLLERMRARMDVSWEPVSGGGGTHAGAGGASPGAGVGARPVGGVGGKLSTGALVLLAVLVLGAGGCASSRAGVAGTSGMDATARTARASIARAVSFLVAAQNPDGGFGGARGQSTSELYSGWAAMGLAAAGRDPASVSNSGRSVLDALRAHAGELQGVGDVERTILALHACGVSVRSLGGKDPVATLLRARARDGSFDRQVNLTAFAIFALRAAGRSAHDSAVRAAVRWLQGQQDRDGGWGFATRGPVSDVDDTAAVVQALVAAGVRRGAGFKRAVGFLVHAQNPDGGYPQEGDGDSNAQSTAWAIQGLVAAGRDVDAIRNHGSRSPMAYLESLIAPDGSVRYSRTSAQTPVWVTAQALTALARAPLPIEPPRG